MLIRDKNELVHYTSDKRIWQGIPAIEVTKKGRILIAFYSGGTKEEVGNYVVLLKSDHGTEFGEPILVCKKEGYRCFDPCLWIDPFDRLWLTWSIMPDHALFAAVCNDPDAEELVWSEPFCIGHDVMMNKPTVLSSGEWLFPIAVWDKGVVVWQETTQKERGSFVYKSIDNGKSFHAIGKAEVANRMFDEHMIIERNDGVLAMYVRTKYGIGISYSYDRGTVWTKGYDSNLGGPCSRFYIRRLKSGRLLLINHASMTERTKLTAFLSEDDGNTWKYSMMLDERANVSYPDASEHDDGYLYITYDRERGAFLDTLDEAYGCAREILLAKITEEDIIAGKPISPKSKLKAVVSKLGKYAYENENPYQEERRFTDIELARRLLNETADKTVEKIFDYYPVKCANMHHVENKILDTLIEEFEQHPKSEQHIAKIIAYIRSVNASGTQEPLVIVDRVKKLISNTSDFSVSVKEAADKCGISYYYLCHIFKKSTGITVTDYKNSLKLTKAKKLLISTDQKIADIAYECGFGSASYFSKIFLQSESVSPAQFRNLMSKSKQK